MRDKMLHLRIRDAKVFRKGMKDTHRMLIDGAGVTPRTDIPGMIVDCPWDTFLHCHVSNALHVLAGERPVPSFRRTPLMGAPERIPLLDDIAAGARVKITSGIMTTPDGEVMPVYGKYGGETMMTRKGWSESRYPVAAEVSLLENISSRVANMFNWDILRAHVKDQTFYALMVLFNGTLGYKCFKRPVLDVIKDMYLNGQQNSQVRQKIELVVQDNKVKSPWKELLLEGKTKNLTSLRSGFGKLDPLFNFSVVRGKDLVVVRDANMYIPVSEEEAGLFSKGNGFASILEGGVVSIEGIEDLDSVIYEDPNAKPVHFHQEVVNAVD